MIRLIASLLFSAAALGATPVGEVERDMAERVKAVMSAFDPGAVVTVKARRAVADVPLPGTPFVFGALLTEDSGKPKIEGLEVTVMTKLPALPDKALGLIRSVTADQTKEVAVNTVNLPELGANGSAAPLGNAAAAVAQGASQAVNVKMNTRALEKTLQQAIAAERSWEGPLKGLLDWAVNRTKTSLFGDAEQDIRKMQDRLARWAIIVLIAVVVIALAVIGMVVTFLTQSQRRNQLLQWGIGKLAESIETASGGGGGRAETLAESRPAPVEAAAAMMDARGDALAEFEDAGLLALMTDCYWSEKDGSAAWLWQRIPMARRKALIAKAAPLADYARMIAAVAPEECSYPQDPYYLDPLPLAQVSNADLVELVRQAPAIFPRLSRVRREALPLTMKEKLTLSQGVAGELPSLAGLKASALRVLKQAASISVRSVEEERELLDLGVDLAAMETIPSLIWLKRLKNMEAQAILNRFSARELAQAWIGPADVLSHLEALIPEKKRQLFNNYRQKTKPTRTAPAFLALHRATLDALREQGGNKAAA
jgi:hypothetical protein